MVTDEERVRQPCSQGTTGGQHCKEPHERNKNANKSFFFSFDLHCKSMWLSHTKSQGS